ncbi:MAG TPA: hypothetical protein V6C64_11760 [Microcoleaceae cyanobacterium]|jgi:hypothetical protein
MSVDRSTGDRAVLSHKFKSQVHPIAVKPIKGDTRTMNDACIPDELSANLLDRHHQ